MVLSKMKRHIMVLSKKAKIIEQAREFQENIYFCFIDFAKAFDCLDHRKLWKIIN